MTFCKFYIKCIASYKSMGLKFTIVPASLLPNFAQMQNQSDVLIDIFLLHITFAFATSVYILHGMLCQVKENAGMYV